VKRVPTHTSSIKRGLYKKSGKVISLASKLRRGRGGHRGNRGGKVWVRENLRVPLRREADEKLAHYPHL